MTATTPQERHQCPGDGRRGCLAEIPADRERCTFCERSMATARRRRGLGA